MTGRITLDPAVMGGRPCIRGMRLTVASVIGQLAAGSTIDEILTDYPYLEREDVLASGAIATLSRGRLRVRRLPIRLA